MTVLKLKADANCVAAAIDILARGGVVVSPTTTNYNLICDATCEAAVERVFAIKRRTKLGPLPVSLPDPGSASDYVVLPAWFDRRILRRMLPGEISFVFQQKYPFPDRLTCGLRTVAISCTTHPVFRAIVKGLDRPVAATSANLSGQGNIFVSLEKAEADVGAEVDLLVDAGPTEAERAGGGDQVNTIVDLTFERPFLVRPGWVPLNRVLEAFPTLDTDTIAYQAALHARAAALEQTKTVSRR
jgi:L-threonylcarbamoyladenylate synthase